MLKRMSCVNELNITSISESSMGQIGDSCHINAIAKVLAVQREYPFFFAQEGRFEDYLTFTEHLSVPPIEFVKMKTIHDVPAIKVNRIDITGVAASSLAHIGSTETFSAESRVLHIRQLLNDRPRKTSNNEKT